MTTHFERMMQVGNRGLSKAEMEILSSFHLEDNDMDWQDDAACKDLGVDFFPETDFTNNSQTAIKICKACPVAERCLEFAMTNNIQYGIWGGKTAQNRRSLKRYRYRRNGREPHMPSSSVIL